MDSRFRRETGRSTDTLVSPRVRGVTCRRVNTASCHSSRISKVMVLRQDSRSRRHRMFITQGRSKAHTCQARHISRVDLSSDLISKTSVRRGERYRSCSRQAIARVARTSVTGAPVLRGTNKCRIAIKSADLQSRGSREIATYVRASRPFSPTRS